MSLLAFNMVKKRKYGSLDAKEDYTIELPNVKRSSQACDRCRLKKIKCDGLKPSCSSCQKIGYQCKTSDKLTRRGFPRGYTEMLEREVIRLQRMYERAVTCSGNNSSPEMRGSTGEGREQLPKQQGQQPLPFINDSFHYYPNYSSGNTYLGNANWHALTGSALDPTQTPSDDVSLTEYITRVFQIEGSGIPREIIRLYRNGVSEARSAVKKMVSAFLKEHSLVPVMYGNDWRARLRAVMGSKDDNQAKPAADPPALLALLYIIQWNCSVFSPETLFNVTKIVSVLACDALSAVQVVLLASQYFMSLPRDLTTGQMSAVPWATQLLNLAFAHIITQGLFINCNKLVPIGSSEKFAEASRCNQETYETRVVTFWVFQFLAALWSFLQGIPKTDFLADEFKPPMVSSLNIVALRPFQILLEHFLQLDGCNLREVLQTQIPRYTYVVESFRHALNHWKLYHSLQDHDLNDIVVDNNERVEIQLTLAYLLPRWLTVRKRPHSHQLSWEILSLYYLLLAHEHSVAKVDSPYAPTPILRVVHSMPWDSWGLIRACFLDLAQAPGYLDKFAYDRYRDLVTNWMHLWYEDDSVYREAMERYGVGNVERFGKPMRLSQVVQSMRSKGSGNVATPGRPLLKPLQSSEALSDPFNMFSNLPVVEDPLPPQWILMSTGFNMLSNEVSASGAITSNVNYGSNSSTLISASTTVAGCDAFAMLAEDEDGYVEDDESGEEELTLSFGANKSVGGVAGVSSPRSMQHNPRPTLFNQRVSSSELATRDSTMLMDSPINHKETIQKVNGNNDTNARKMLHSAGVKDSKLDVVHYDLIPESIATKMGEKVLI
ncbi:HBR436Cp [Eremothecium sinecaudum]|uniref:HBR436Cp n=1 Tax=Eremothecium sinecaudum TaxID=45286 RepID=A0A120K1F8_9SACH|nr:HBR436Cp [Eremothecium sinecaudum]AMD19337.1 HBR436Cp [Eremothecium sinecaudum]